MFLLIVFIDLSIDFDDQTHNSDIYQSIDLQNQFETWAICEAQGTNILRLRVPTYDQGLRRVLLSTNGVRWCVSLATRWVRNRLTRRRRWARACKTRFHASGVVVVMTSKSDPVAQTQTPGPECGEVRGFEPMPGGTGVSAEHRSLTRTWVIQNDDSRTWGRMGSYVPCSMVYVLWRVQV